MVQHLRKLISLFHENHPDKPTAIFETINTALSMAKSIVQPTAIKQKRGQSANNTNKQAKSWVAFDIYYVLRQIWVISMLNIISYILRDRT